jgi:hypothetical protein
MVGSLEVGGCEKNISSILHVWKIAKFAKALNCMSMAMVNGQAKLRASWWLEVNLMAQI